MASSETDCPLTNLVFDLRNHNEETRKRLLSAADFFLRDIFDNPLTDPITDPLTSTDFPMVYIVMGKANCATFMAAKLFALNMLHLEDAIIKYCSVGDLLQMSNEELNSMIEEVLKLKEQKNKQDKEPTYPKGTGLSVYTIWDAMEGDIFEPKDDDSSSDLCHICKEELINNLVSTLPYCQHEFHTRCTERRLAENPLCPICQKWALPIQAEYPKWIKDCEKVREFLTRDSSASFLGQRYIISLSVFHSLMAAHLRELELRNVFKSFQQQIHTIIGEFNMIRKEVVEFIKDCRYIEEGLVQRFHSFMEMTFRALCLDHVHQNEFRKRIREVDVHELKYWSSIRKLSRFVQAVEYVQGGV